MLVKEILNRKNTSISLEFFPPKTKDSSASLFENIRQLIPLKPSYVSVTYGAGGSTRELTHNLILRLQKETNLTIVSHLTCVGASKDSIKKILEQYNEHGIHNIMALRGDPPLEQKTFEPHPDGFKYAFELVSFIKKHFPNMCIGIAGFPEGHAECPNRLKEIDYLKEKVDCGADYICTQLFFKNDDYYDFVERCRLAKIDIPIIAGIMPIKSIEGMKKMAQLALGARFPAPLLKAVNRASNDESIKKVGNHWAAEQIRDLIDNNTKGIHLYTFNQAKSTLEIYKALGIENSDDLIT